MIQINIDPFSKSETLNYLTDKASDIRFTDDGFERFYRCTKGIPAYINAFCNLLNPSVVYDADMIKDAFVMQIDQIVIMWVYVWGRLNNSEKEIIKLLVENDCLILKDIQNLSKLSKTTIIKYLDLLSMKGIIKFTQEGYVLNDEVLKVWLLHKYETDGHYPF